MDGDVCSLWSHITNQSIHFSQGQWADLKLWLENYAYRNIFDRRRLAVGLVPRGVHLDADYIYQPGRIDPMIVSCWESLAFAGCMLLELMDFLVVYDGRRRNNSKYLSSACEDIDLE